MATYKKDKGVNVKSYTEDPDKTYPSAFEGQLYYNSSDGQFKFIGLGTGAWASGGNLNNGRYRMNGGSGTQSSALVVAGANPPSNHTESYNGTSWTEDGNYPASSADVSVCGASSTSALAVTGIYDGPVSDECFIWDGSSWTETGDYGVPRGRVTSCGTTTAALAAGGEQSPFSPEPAGYNNETYTFNGTAWTSAPNYPINVSNGGMGGTSTASIKTGGYNGSPIQVSNTWNGSAWTEVAELNVAHSETGMSGNGTTSAFMIFGGGIPGPANRGTVEEFDGTSWTEVADLSTARGAGGSAGTTTAAVFGGGSPPGTSYAGTEEWNYTHAFKKVTTS